MLDFANVVDFIIKMEDLVGLFKFINQTCIHSNAKRHV
jgi:hypothetical protein